MINLVVFAGLLSLFASGAVAEDFSISFTWDGLKSCTSRNPNRVGNPSFVVKGLPEGTQYVRFTMKDLDVRSYNHGGGVVKMSADGTVPSDAFKCKSPCLPNGIHTYE
ncbi:hypothetical protein GS610_06705 [Ruegeria sp. HKCCD6228]|uniref:hypothetical protein n=1 Tax=Ruegeria sp. HKCCD6228 TaxID=2683001 RepID=UPI001490B22D|nr:hypothetical protein [Ruegeria sp. HKCCD6228]NOD96896.1 hypothetical protein [Ruegeria sp. HKCCD6228]